MTDNEKICEIDAIEIDEVSGGMRLGDYSNNINVGEAQPISRYYFGRQTGPMAGGYVFA